MKLGYPKQFYKIGGKPILAHTIHTFLTSEVVEQLIVVVPEEHVQETRELIEQHQLSTPKLCVIAGGSRRQDSVFCGLQQVDPEMETVLVHDGVRPFVKHELINACHQAAILHGAAIAAIPVKDTLKKQTPDQHIESTIDREGLWQAQTPQAARRDLLIEAYAINGNRDVTDEAGLFEAAGIPVVLVEGAETNIKITRPEDLSIAEKFIGDAMVPQFRIGHGFDAHRFQEGRELVLGGVTIPHNHGLAGHSDADVLTHAICDAILGAIGKGDIGKHFPDSAEEFKNIYSITLLERVMESLEAMSFCLVNIDATIVCQQPRLAGYINNMRDTLSAACKINPNQINIKATTTEKMGYTGRAEGISSHAVALIQSQKKHVQDTK